MTLSVRYNPAKLSDMHCEACGEVTRHHKGDSLALWTCEHVDRHPGVGHAGAQAELLTPVAAAVVEAIQEREDSVHRPYSELEFLSWDGNGGES